MENPMLEIEVKFHLPSPETVRREIQALGVKSRGRVFEINYLHDDAAGTLQKRSQLLRLRQDREVRLTFKSKPSGEESDPRFKVLREIEVVVGDLTAAAAILDALGYRRCRVYEKWRETWRIDSVVLCLDALPFGDFLEIEGPSEEILAVAAKLGIDWHRRIVLNYLEIFERIRERFNLQFNDVTFDAFFTVRPFIDRRLARMLEEEFSAGSRID
jgi:adenylate cyclase class 2